MAIIKDPDELTYIGEILSQVLSDPQKLGSVEEFRTAIKHLSLKKGREVQTHLMAHPQEKAIGVSFSFADNPADMTPTLSWLTPHQIAVAAPAGTSIESAPTRAIVPLPPSGTPLAVRETQPVADSQEARKEQLKSAPSELDVRSLASFANQLVARNQLDGLWLTGLSLSAIANLSRKRSEKPVDKQSTGEAIVRRFQQLLPERFEQLNRGEGDIQPFTWKDPNSGKRYRFEFGIEKGENDAVKIRLSGLELAKGNRPSVFEASSWDGGRRWAIAQNEFTPEQLKSLILAERLGDRGKSPKTLERER